MKTSILKWDLRVQIGMVVINLLAVATTLVEPTLLLIVQFLIGTYQLCSSALHIFLKHKSIGFTQWRVRHLFGSLLYLVFLAAFGSTDFMGAAGFVILVIIVPQIILFAYVGLCKKELEFIQEREFHILK
ncbi:MAG: hypothetical protein RLZZ367_1583 [Bacteroidota bacterium]|jgi:hypothetical protein